MALAFLGMLPGGQATKAQGAANLEQTKALPHSRRKSLKAKGNVKNSCYFQLQYLMIKKLILSWTKPQRGGGRWAQSPTSGEQLLVTSAGQERDRVNPRSAAPGRSNTLQCTDTLKSIQAALMFCFFQ